MLYSSVHFCWQRQGSGCEKAGSCIAGGVNEQQLDACDIPTWHNSSFAVWFLVFLIRKGQCLRIHIHTTARSCQLNTEITL